MDDITLAHFYAGTIGLGLLRHWYVDGTANAARLAELAEVIADQDQRPLALALNPAEHDLLAGYAEWAAVYDGANPMVDAEEAALLPILRSLTSGGGDALDAACGTGRHAAQLARLGWSVTGVDQSEEMLTVARAKVPDAPFHRGDIRSLPLPDESFDLAVAALALCHLADPTDAIVDLGRVLRPGGALVISDPHPSSAIAGGQAFYGGISPDRPMTWVRNHCHNASTWLRAFRAAGLTVDQCEELPYTEAQIAVDPVHARYPAASRAALEGLGFLWIWVLRKPED